MRSYGIMQGRLTPSKGRGIQFFPFDNWRQEFMIAEQIGLNEIEWIFDYDRYHENPLWTQEGTRTVKSIIENTGIGINSVCFDYFMRRPFFKRETDLMTVRNENCEMVKRIVDRMKCIGATLLEMPFVDDSSIKSDYERKMVIEFIQQLNEMTIDSGVLIGLETDLPVGYFRNLLEEIGLERIKANYDSGNSSGLGYNHRDEILSLSDTIANVHIKDRKLHGTTMFLGTGDADFDAVFSSLKAVNYSGSFILQAARGNDGEENQTIRAQLAFVKDYCDKYGLE